MEGMTNHRKKRKFISYDYDELVIDLDRFTAKEDATNFPLESNTSAGMNRLLDPRIPESQVHKSHAVEEGEIQLPGAMVLESHVQERVLATEEGEIQLPDAKILESYVQELESRVLAAEEGEIESPDPKILKSHVLSTEEDESQLSDPKILESHVQEFYVTNESENQLPDLRIPWSQIHEPHTREEGEIRSPEPMILESQVLTTEEGEIHSPNPKILESQVLTTEKDEIQSPDPMILESHVLTTEEGAIQSPDPSIPESQIHELHTTFSVGYCDQSVDSPKYPSVPKKSAKHHPTTDGATGQWLKENTPESSISSSRSTSPLLGQLTSDFPAFGPQPIPQFSEKPPCQMQQALNSSVCCPKPIPPWLAEALLQIQEFEPQSKKKYNPKIRKSITNATCYILGQIIGQYTLYSDIR